MLGSLFSTIGLGNYHRPIDDFEGRQPFDRVIDPMMEWEIHGCMRLANTKATESQHDRCEGKREPFPARGIHSERSALSTGATGSCEIARTRQDGMVGDASDLLGRPAQGFSELPLTAGLDPPVLYCYVRHVWLRRARAPLGAQRDGPKLKSGPKHFNTSRLGQQQRMSQGRSANLLGRNNQRIDRITVEHQGEVAAGTDDRHAVDHASLQFHVVVEKPDRANSSILILS